MHFLTEATDYTLGPMHCAESPSVTGIARVTVVQARVVPCRVKPGEWLGPWVLCHTLEAVMKKMEPGSLNVHVHVVSQPGGAVPVLYTARSATHLSGNFLGKCPASDLQLKPFLCSLQLGLRVV